MKFIYGLICLLLSSFCFASEPTELPPERIKTLVTEVNDAVNKMMRSGSKIEDVEALYSKYSDDFVYVHEVYGGVYSREQLYKNTVRALNDGRYKLEKDRYQILNIIPGLNAAAVERLELNNGKIRLTVFEFKGEKVSKIVEYWK